MKIKNIQYVIVPIIIIILFLIYYRRYIDITIKFGLYDMYALYGCYWRMTPEYCSPMKS